MSLATARRLRAAMTDAERRLWQSLRLRQIDGHRFRRQHPLGPFVADFVCLESRLIVELDGGQHGDAEQARADEERTAWLATRGYRVIRFWNNDVFSNLDGVMEAIARAAGRLVSPHPVLPPQGGKGPNK